jgi:hypothetical protein
MITTISLPSKISTVFNPINFIVDSDNKNEDNFEYIFDLYESNGVTLGTRLIRVRIPQEPISGWGVYNPMKILQSQIENVFNKSLTGCTPQDYVEYSILVGEAYTYDWTFDSVFGTAVSGSSCLLNLTLTGSTQHYYNVGDKINISGSSISAYNGNWDILQVPSSTSIVLDLCVSSLSSTSGTTKLFNDEVTFFTGLTSFTEYYANNAAIDTYEFIPYRVEGFVRDNYYPSITGGTNANWYTNCPDGYNTRITNRGTFTYFNGIYTGSTYPTPNILEVTTSDGGLFHIDLTCNEKINDIGVFPWNLNNSSPVTVLSGSTPIIKDVTESYTITLKNNIYAELRFSFLNTSSMGTLPVTIEPAGIYNTKNYYTFNAGMSTYFLWYDSGLMQWVVSNALGGGTDYLYSINPGGAYTPPTGSISDGEWISGTSYEFVTFNTISTNEPNLLIPFTFNLYDFCHKYDNFEFIFMDRKGSFVPMNFELVQRKNVGVERKTYKRGLNNNYDYLDRGTTVVQNNIRYSYTVVSNWMNEDTSTYFEELLTSPEIYWNYEGGGTFIPIVLTKTQEEIKNKKNSRLISYTLEFTLSNNPIGMVG